MANAVAIHNQLVRERPDLAAALYEPLPYDTRGEQADGAPAFYSVPAFTEHAGRLFVRFIPQYILASQRHPDAPRLSATAREAIAAASALANDPDFNVYMDLQPGEMQFINNYHVLHGRTAYEDDVAHGYKRHLKRLWLATYALDGPAGVLRRARAAQPLGGPALGEHAAGGRAGRHRAVALTGLAAEVLARGRSLRAREQLAPRAHQHRPLDERGRQRTLAQDADGRRPWRRPRVGGGPSRRPPSTTSATSLARKACATSSASVKRSGTVRHGPCSRHSRRRARPSGMPTTTAQAPYWRAVVGRRHGAPSASAGPRSSLGSAVPAPEPADGRNTSTGPGQQRCSSVSSSSVHPEVSACTSSICPTA